MNFQAEASLDQKMGNCSLSDCSMADCLAPVARTVLPCQSNGMNRILDGLYLGNIRDSRDRSQLTANNITHILSIFEHKIRDKKAASFIRLRFNVYDLPTENIRRHFSVANDFIHSARLSGGNVLVHCFAGMSRSATVVIAYIMSTTDCGYSDALDFVMQARCVDPNFGFKRQLIDFERDGLLTERLRMRTVYGDRWRAWNYRQLMVSADPAAAASDAKEDVKVEKAEANGEVVTEDSVESNRLIAESVLDRSA